jgi:Kef-type K+ transport system membrane component KefB
VSDAAVAAILLATILVASTISVEVGLSVALIELALGVVVGNAFHVSIPDWLSFVGSFAGIVLTFLAGAEVDVPQFRREWKASLVLGGVSFAGPFVVAGLFAYFSPSTGTGARRRSPASPSPRPASRSSTPCSSRRG